MKEIYHISKAPVGYADHQYREEHFIQCESEEEYLNAKEQYQGVVKAIYAREYYDAHMWQGQHFDAVGFSNVTENEYIRRTTKHFLRPESVTNRERVQVIDNWW